ncbi:MAG: hypothetical protein RIB93_03905 [Coleofasciculus sp. D1-CHI-01]|uniref:hypothetical protein n=1 Tax=Coleofasciculus sp. D1-CHI-01 TaxID=3068482 RepID=UPI0033035769
MENYFVSSNTNQGENTQSSLTQSLSVKLLPSVYHSEPKSGASWSKWGGKWKRNMFHGSENQPCIRWRKESDDTYVVQDPEGVVWLMNEVSLKKLLGNKK